MGFDFAGTYTKVVEHQLIECALGDRVLVIEFIGEEDERQAILDRFARYVENE